MRKKAVDLLDIPKAFKRKAGATRPELTLVETVKDLSPKAVLPEGVAYRRVYYVRGGKAKHWVNTWFVKDPPTSGFARAFVLGGESAKKLTIFCPFTLQSYSVPRIAGELLEELELTENQLLALVETMTTKWNEYIRYGFQRDYDVAALVLTKLGADVPTASLTDTTIERAPGAAPPKERKERKGGKPCAAALKKPVDRTSKRGKVADFFLGSEQKSVRECMARLEMTRNSVLSALHVLNKDHGVGYSVVNDTASIVIPPDWDIWA
jgi:hypothetical protein